MRHPRAKQLEDRQGFQGYVDASFDFTISEVERAAGNQGISENIHRLADRARDKPGSSHPPRESDVLILVSEAHEFFGEIAYSDKTLRIYPRGTPGCAHCQLDAIGTAQRASVTGWTTRRVVVAP